MQDKVKKQQTVIFKSKPRIVGHYSIVGKKEGEGVFGQYFDEVYSDDMFHQKSFEKAERQLLKTIIEKGIKSSGFEDKDIDLLLCGDLLDQIVSSSFVARDLNTSFIGLYSACSTMSESLALGACLIDGGHFNNIVCATASHFSSSERQYRFPLELGNQRPPMSQWTVTGGGCSVLTKDRGDLCITSATFGKVEDYGINDPNNMGGAMAPAARSSLCAHFKNTNTKPDDYDLIVTGDLGKHGSDILRELMNLSGYELGDNYMDCGHYIFDKKQNTNQGGSGSGCSASVLNSFIYKKMTQGDYNKVLFAATGALLSPLTSQQGETIPSICHVVTIERVKGE